MFKRLHKAGADAHSSISLLYEGQAVACQLGDTVATALLANGQDALRDTPVSGVSRGPYCMMGICYDCLVTIDGQPNQQACMTPARAGMVVLKQCGAREVMP